MKPRPRPRNAFDPARQRLRELERVVDDGAAVRADRFLAPVARALLLVRRNKPGAVSGDALLDRLRIWAQRHAPDAQDAQLQQAVSEAIERPYLDKADRLAQLLGLTYDRRQRLSVRTIGACDADKAERARLATIRKRERDRARRAAERRAAGAKAREEWLAESKTRTQPWREAGVSKRTWYRRQAAGGTGPSLGGTGPSPQQRRAAGTGSSPHISLTAQQPTCASAAAPARRAGNRRAFHPQGEPLALAADRGRRDASAPHSAVASGPPADPVNEIPDHFLGQPSSGARLDLASNGVSAAAGEHAAAPAAPAAAGLAAHRQMFQLREWGASSADARKLLASLVKAAGPDRQSEIERMFGMIAKRRGIGDRQRLEWLRKQVAKMEAHRDYRPHFRAPHPKDRANAAAILAALAKIPNHQANKAKLARLTGIKPNTLSELTVYMVKCGELVRVEPGVFAMPQPGVAKNYVTAAVAIRGVLLGVPGNKATVADLVSVTGKGRNAIYSSAWRMVERGELIRVNEGTYALPGVRA